jgi:hypothetical protein
MLKQKKKPVAVYDKPQHTVNPLIHQIVQFSYTPPTSDEIPTQDTLLWDQPEVPTG